MKNLILALAIWVLPTLLSAQSFATKDVNTGSIDWFMEVAIMPTAFKSNLNVWYLGDGGKYSILSNEEGKPFTFVSYVQIFNWLKKYGYEMKQQMPVPPALVADKPIAVFLFEKK